MGLRVSVVGFVAISIGGVVQVSMTYAAMRVLEVLMKHPITKLPSVWCGAALLWRPVPSSI